MFEPSTALEELDIGANIVKSRGSPQLQSFLTLLSVFVTKNQSLRVLKMAGQVRAEMEKRERKHKSLDPFLF